jgi:hypothetical protein
MQGRCKSSAHKSWDYYGGRGVTVCGQWDNFDVFLKDMGYRPEGTTLDRIDPNGNYEPGNCRWADALTQRNNCRDNKLISFRGVEKTPIQWARGAGISGELLRWRISHGWTMEQCMTLPPDFKPRRLRLS